MQWIIGHEAKLCLIIIYIVYQSGINCLQWNVESTSELDFERVGTPMGFNGPHSEHIYHDDTIYKGWIGSKFTIMHKDVLVITQDCIGDSEQILWIGLID